MTRPRPLESSAFVLVLGTLLAHHGGIEAVAPFQSHRMQQQQHHHHHHQQQQQQQITSGGEWVRHRRAGAGAGVGMGAGTTAELVPCERSFGGKKATTTTPSSQGGANQSSLVMTIAAALRGGRSMRQSAAAEQEPEEEEVGEEEDEDEEGEDDEEEEEEEEEVVLYDEKAVEWMMQQLCMYQTRTALISSPLAAKGYKLREIVPSPRGLLCAISTTEKVMDCRMYVEAEVGKKVVAPCKCKGTQKWISFSALNSERRKDAVKWKNCPTCQGPIDYKLYEAHGGGAGKAVSAVLNNARATRLAIGAVVGIVFVIFAPVLHVLVVRLLTSGVLWKNYHRLGFFVQMPLPLQILGIRFLMKWTVDQLLVLDSVVREFLTDVESHILESRLPVTVQVQPDGEEVVVPHRQP